MGVVWGDTVKTWIRLPMRVAMIALLLVLLVVPVAVKAEDPCVWHVDPVLGLILDGKCEGYRVIEGAKSYGNVLKKIWLKTTWGIYDTHANETILECSPDLKACSGTPALEQFAQCHRRMQEAMRDMNRFISGIRIGPQGGKPIWWPDAQQDFSRTKFEWDSTMKECVR